MLQQITNGVSMGAVYALIAVGYTMVYGVLQLINFAHGEIYMFGAYFAYYPAKWMGYVSEKEGAKETVPLHIVGGLFLVAVAACSLLGAIIERFAYRPLRNSSRLAALITAIGVSFLLQNVAQNMFGANPLPFPRLMEPGSMTVEIAGVTMAGSKLVIVIVASVMMLGLHLFVEKTKPGMAMRACSFDMRTARLMGVNVNRTISLTFVLGSAMAAVGGILVAMDQPRLMYNMGLMPGLKAFVAAVLGGIGSIPGAALGGLLLGVTEGVVSYFDTQYKDAVAFAVLIIVLMVKPTGILGKAGREKV